MAGAEAMKVAGVAMSKAGAEAMKASGAEAMKEEGVAMSKAGVVVDGDMVAVEGEEWAAVVEGTERKIHGLLVFLQCMLYYIREKRISYQSI